MIKLALDSKQLLDKVFRGVPRGYDPYEVDSFIDEIIKDYLLVENNVLSDRKEIDNLNRQIAELKEENRTLEIEIGKYKSRFSNIKSTDNVTSDNMELIKTINKYEKFLFQNGFNPKNIK